MTQASKQIKVIDEKLSAPGLSSDALQDLMRERATLSSTVEGAELEWLEATEAYESALHA